MEQDDLERMFVEWVELLNAGWVIRVEPTLNAEQMMGVPVVIKFVRSQPDAPTPEKGLRPNPAIEVNRYQLRTELPRVIHLFHSLVIPPRDDAGQ